MAKDAFNKEKEFLTRGMSNEAKKIMKTVIWSVSIYSDETLSLIKEASACGSFSCSTSDCRQMMRRCIALVIH